MTKASEQSGRGSLPQLSGRLLWLYRLAWCSLAVGAVLVSALAPFHGGPYPAIVALRLVKSAALIGVATILFCRRQRDPVAALLALAFLTWTITSTFDFGTKTEIALLLDRLRFVLFALALLLFPDGRWEPRWTRSIAGVSAAVFLIGIGEALNVPPTRVFLPLAIACVLAAIGSLVARFRRSTNNELKQQLKWVALGLVAGISLILCARAGSATGMTRLTAMPLLWETMFQLGIVIIAIGFLIALLRYRLFDAESIISRSAAYATLTIALVATFGGTEAIIENIGQSYLGMGLGSISGAMAAAVAAVLLNPLHGRITEWAEHRFHPDLEDLKRTMPELLVHQGSTTTRRLCRAVLRLLNLAIHAERSAILFDGRVAGASGVELRAVRRWAHEWPVGRSDRLGRDRCDPLFPIRLPIGNDPSASAWLLIGPRPDGTLYARKDLDAVRFILPALEKAMVAAKAREKLNAAIDRREKLLRTEIRHISARLCALEKFLNRISSMGGCKT